jgi:NTE family protein
MHLIDGEDVLRDYSASSKDDTNPKFLHELFTRGREVAQRWLAASVGKIGRASSIDIAARFL